MGEQVAAAAGQRPQLGKDSERLTGERHFVIIAHLHFLGGDQPYAVLLVKLGPLGQPQLAGQGVLELFVFLSLGLAHCDWILTLIEQLSALWRFSRAALSPTPGK